MDFIGKKVIWFAISLIIIAIGAVSIFTKGLNYGIDFTGGTTVILRFEKTPNLESVREVLADFELKEANISFISSIVDDQKDLLIKTVTLSESKRSDILASMKTRFGEYIVIEIDMVGPSIGEELKQNSIIILILVVLSLLMYITFRFEFWYGLAAIIALLHDALITLGFASLLQLEVDTAFVAAILTVLGYSINDTIVLFDRFRENSKKIADIKELSNRSILQTLPRSINTSLTTLFVIGALYFFGGATIKDFSLVLLIGIASGTYSSIFIASPVYNIFKNKFK